MLSIRPRLDPSAAARDASFADLSAPSPLDLGIEGFPFFRSGQFSIAADIAASHARFRFLSAPTGTGKSLIYRTAAILAGASRTLVLVDTKTLQDQLVTSFAASGMTDIRGHSNYSCARSTFSDSGDELLDIECHARRDGACLYDAAVERAKSRDIVVTNIANWISISLTDDPLRFGKFDLIIIDEAHGTPFRVPELLRVKVRAEALARFGLSLPDDPLRISPSAWCEWATVAAFHLSTLADKVQQETGGSDRATLVKIRNLARVLSRLVRMVKIEASPSAWVIEKEGGAAGDYTITPVWSAPFNEEFLFRDAPAIILSSATLSKSIARYLGISLSAFSYHETDSLFPVERRPFIYIPTARIDDKTMQSPGVVSLWLSRIDQIAAKRQHLKGIIPSGSYQRARDIVSRSKFKSSMITHEKGGLAEALERFRRASAPAILVSPAIEEGVDFAHDLARWQIIPKVPLISTAGALAEARKKSDPQYSLEISGQRLVQAYGRIVRATSDWGETFLIDNHWEWFRKRVDFARWFSRAWKDTALVPDALDPATFRA